MLREKTCLGGGTALATLPAESPSRRRKGLVLPIVIAVVVIFTIIGVAILTLAEQEAILGRIEADKARAFYLAEAGIAKLQEKLQVPVVGDIEGVEEETLELGRYHVDVDVNQNPCYAISTGVSGNIHKKIRVQLNFLAPPFENAVYAMNEGGGAWAFQLRGKGKPIPYGSFPGRERGGKDIVNGNIFVDGDVFLYEESSVNPAPAPNIWSLNGDVGATGNISVLGGAYISGESSPNADEPPDIDVTMMDYANNNTHDVAQIFQDASVGSGHLPAGNELRDVFVKNPSDRNAECKSTGGVDDYFFEPSSGFVTGGPYSGDTPLNAGDDRVYYVDGDVWIHSYPTYGFKMDGKVTIVATGDIHVCDNLQYKDNTSMLGLIALGKYNNAGKLISGGNIYFGDPVYGNMSVFSAMMYAANDFLFNTDRITSKSAEPDTGFTINGSFAAMGKVTIERDWYTRVNGSKSEDRPALYDTATGQWIDSQTGQVLTSTEKNTLRHYQMIVNYDDRVRDAATQPPGLPRGGASIFAGFSNWEEL